jgi:hypothetical protein
MYAPLGLVNERPKYTHPDVPNGVKRIINMDLEYMSYDEFAHILINIYGTNLISLASSSTANVKQLLLPVTTTITRSFTYNVFRQQTISYDTSVPNGRNSVVVTKTIELPHTDCNIDVIKICPLDWESSQLESFTPLTKEFCRRFEHPVPRDEPVHYSVFAKMFAVLNSIVNEYESLTWTDDQVYEEARKLRCVLMRGGFV